MIYNDQKSIEIHYADGIDTVNKRWLENELIPDTLTLKKQQSIKEAFQLALRSNVVILVVGDVIQTSEESRTRTDINLLGHQEALVEAIVKTRKLIVFVLVWEHSATINFTQKYCPTILAAGYPGAQDDRAIAEALKDNYNPGGKLNGTWPESVGQLPIDIPTKPNTNYEPMNNYTLGNKGLLYCFGYGLSYTTFDYSNLHIDNIYSSTGKIKITCDIKNTDNRGGDEIVQLYLNDAVSSTTTYEKDIQDFEQVYLEPNEIKSVTFSIVPDDLMLINKKGERVVEYGEFRVIIDTSYNNIKLRENLFVSDDSNISLPIRSNKEGAKIMDNPNRPPNNSY